jgi:acetyl-CoA acyltransferase
MSLINRAGLAAVVICSLALTPAALRAQAETHDMSELEQLPKFSSPSSATRTIQGSYPTALKRAGITAKDIDVMEINEAFAAQSIPCIAARGCPVERVNIEGGAIALGHPLGASGARITGKAALLLSRSKGKYALATACIGGGMGIATVLEKA